MKIRFVQQGLEEILDSYKTDISREPFHEDNRLSWLFEAVEGLFRDKLPVKSRATLHVEKYIGEQEWARVPGILFRDERETHTIREGVFVFLLLAEDMSGAYLTLNQGLATMIEKKGKAYGRDLLAENAARLRHDCELLQNYGFEVDGNIVVSKDISVADDFAASTIAYKFYEKNQVPIDLQILKDLDAVLKCYDAYLQQKPVVAPVEESSDLAEAESDAQDGYGDGELSSTPEMDFESLAEKEELVLAEPSPQEILAEVSKVSEVSEVSEVPEVPEVSAVEPEILDTIGREEPEPVSLALSDNKGSLQEDPGFTLQEPQPETEPMVESAAITADSQFDLGADVSIEPQVPVDSAEPETEVDLVLQEPMQAAASARSANPGIWDALQASRASLMSHADSDGLGESVPVASSSVVQVVRNLSSHGPMDSWVAPEDIADAQNLIIYGPPGTGKTHALTTQYLKDYEDGAHKRYALVTFHQSYSYEDFVEGIRPTSGSNGVQYEVKDGVFKDVCRRARHDPAHRYAVLIDEINRGNVVKILGELITLIEQDKRAVYAADGSLSAGLEVALPYSGEKFSVPKNVDIIGTMNTADRSIALLDSALRRRFNFLEMIPDSSVIRGGDGSGAIDDGEGGEIDLRTLLNALNKRLRFLLHRDQMLGQAYFTDVKTFADLKQVFLTQILPLLQEYFYDDWHRLQLVFRDVDADGEKIEPQIVCHAVVREQEALGADYNDYDDQIEYWVVREQDFSPAAIRKIYSI